jgi:hypothetical protein
LGIDHKGLGLADDILGLGGAGPHPQKRREADEFPNISPGQKKAFTAGG